MSVTLFVSWPRSSTSPLDAAPAVIVAAAKKAPAVKSWLLPDWLTKVRVTGCPARSRIGWGANPELRTVMVIDCGVGCEAAGLVARRKKAAAAARRVKDIGKL